MSEHRSPIHRASLAMLAGLLLLGALPATVALAATNDDRASAVVVDTLPFFDTQDTTTATTALDDPDCHGNGPTVWYEFQSATTIDVVATTEESNYDTTLSVYVEESGALTQVACNDDHISVQAALGWTAEAGVTYLVMVGAFASGPGGELSFIMYEGVLQPPFEPIDVSLDILGAARERSGQVTVELSITCSESAEAIVFPHARQRAGRVYVDGYGFAHVVCGPDPVIVSATTDWVTGVFVSGPATIGAYAEAWNDTGYGFAATEETVRLRMAR